MCIVMGCKRYIYRVKHIVLGPAVLFAAAAVVATRARNQSDHRLGLMHAGGSGQQYRGDMSGLLVEGQVVGY